jgi:hypothetical protein
MLTPPKSLRLPLLSWAAGLVLATAGAPTSAQTLTLAQQAYLKASNTDFGDEFGFAVAASGDTVAVGAWLENSNEPEAGAVYVFVRSGTTWSQQAYLKPANNDADDHFGHVVALSGDTLVVGTASEDSSATGVDGDESDDSMESAGAAYVFVRSGTTWTQQAYLKASNTEAQDAFGISVAVSGDSIVVGAVGEDSSATGVDGDQDDNGAVSSGAAYVFARSGTTWSQQAYLKASNTAFDDEFGRSVALSGDAILVGADQEDSSATGVNGSQADGAAQAGAAYVFTRSGTTWSQQAYLKASNTDPGDGFGQWVALDGDTAVVGVPKEDSIATGIDGDQGDDSAMWAGAAYVFTRSGTSWSQQAYLKASNTDAGDQFGIATSVSGDTLVVGASTEDSRAKGIDGNQADDSSSNSGAVYLFARDGGTWSQQAYVKASNTSEGDGFGLSVGLSGTLLVSGAFRDDSSATGVNGNQNDNGAPNAGAAFTFEIGPNPWTDLGSALAGVNGLPILHGTGTLVAGSGGSLSLSSASLASLSMLFSSVASSPVPFKCGTLVPVPVVFQLPLLTNGGGALALTWPAWPTGLSGLDLYFQYAIADPSAACGVALSNALRADVP